VSRSIPTVDSAPGVACFRAPKAVRAAAHGLFCLLVSLLLVWNPVGGERTTTAREESWLRLLNQGRQLTAQGERVKAEKALADSLHTAQDLNLGAVPVAAYGGAVKNVYDLVHGFTQTSLRVGNIC